MEANDIPQQTEVTTGIKLLELTMLIISLTSMIEEAASTSQLIRRHSGNVLEPDKLFERDSLDALEKAHSGVFGFLAYDPSTDLAVKEYLQSGALASDSGPKILVLFTTAGRAWRPKKLTEKDLTWVDVDDRELPARRLVRELFGPKDGPILPGLLVFETFEDGAPTLYFDLSDAVSAADVQRLLRQIFRLVDSAALKKEFHHSLAVASQQQRIKFNQSSRGSLRQWIIRAYQYVSDRSGDIVAALGLIPVG